jgi:hypothetical protein
LAGFGRGIASWFLALSATVKDKEIEGTTSLKLLPISTEDLNVGY